MVLGRVQVNGVDSSRALQSIREDVVTGAGDGENYVVGLQLQDALVYAGVFPGKCIDILVIELGMLLQLVVVVYPIVMVLVKERGEW